MIKQWLTVSIAALLLLLPAAVHADWEPTRWGMTMDEVRRVVPAATDSPSGDSFRAPGYGDDRTRSSAYLYTRIVREDRTYDVRLGFDDGRLRSVEFALLNATEQLCDMARGNLQRRFGTPAGGGAGEGGRFDSWTADNDQVVFIYRTQPRPRCVILYAPLKPTGAGKHLPPGKAVLGIS